MKPTIRVSIGGLAFNVEEDAYHVLDNYLQSLKRHFSGSPEADEITGDIETRLSELLQIRMNNKDGVVSLTDAQEIIKIMGNPKDFDDSEPGTVNDEKNGSDHKQKAYSEYTQDLFKKKLLRDVDNKIIGGVCSGLSHYLRIDPTAIRLTVAGIFVFLFIVANRWPACMTVILIYIILWIVMPAARTFKQRLEMTGSDPSIENIEDRTQPIASRKYRGSAISTILDVFINIIAGIVAAVALIYLIATIVILVWLYMDTDILASANYLVLMGYNTWNFKIAVILAIILPAGALFDLMVKIIRRSAFTTQTLISFIIGLVIWIVSLSYLGNTGAQFAYSHQNSGEATEQLTISMPSDTLYVKLGEEYLDATPQPNNTAMFYKGNKLRNRQICILPTVIVKEDTTSTDYKVEIRKKDFGENEIAAKRKAEALHMDYAITDSVLTINPKWYDNHTKWNAETFEAVITRPKNKTVVLGTLLKDSYHINAIRINGYDFYSYHSDFDFN
ncbi:phage shock protein PspC (stress-responsive transcriptional regulator) [Dysgonomonas sp. PFB1-18]|uniref:PspC domain-containing protein n=1 Tax=unclassified Dysgonomonas TaxID=2630389 RepID=UPI0024752520|nr:MULTISPECIES: PspC domain-containing protein [unclassified Dysgonomonas]MDH6307695.1 phage shock protein PspC (stress-responsive transcriptional regulator) [Dysgonomonas sp. PF1-14]MDH6337613.1 phage shock protein PspC (stress-responsive transcriptional regulator) [Dysgonomonas sp. PF1-16]MDH6378837.1 phage shock protein PspC (stress-responsive transcriptional regulator) [Dysgonomonas sp. PFB1-18]MDH6396472.1 phage shock protein PspC (stress-responsive transcriptional regulator) [Dysgonomona